MSHDSDQSSSKEESRRSFGYEVAAVVIGAIISLGPFLVGLFTFLDPLSAEKKNPVRYRKSSGGREGFVRIASLDAVEINSAPQRFPVIANKTDAWNFEPDQAIGAVFVERTADQEIRVFNATCPHAGCSVSCDGVAFNCPCHNSSFKLDGSKRVSSSGRENPSPRSLDKLEIDTDKLQNGEIWIEFKNFYTGKEEAIPKE